MLLDITWATLTALSSASCTRPENKASRPRLRVTAANTATRMAGTTAIAENQATSRTCSLAPARPERRVAHSRASRQPIRAASVRTSVKLISARTISPAWSGVKGVSPVSSA